MTTSSSIFELRRQVIRQGSIRSVSMNLTEPPPRMPSWARRTKHHLRGSSLSTIPPWIIPRKQMTTTTTTWSSWSSARPAAWPSWNWRMRSFPTRPMPILRRSPSTCGITTRAAPSVRARRTRPITCRRKVGRRVPGSKSRNGTRSMLPTFPKPSVMRSIR